MHWYLRTSVPHDVEWSSLEIILIHLLAEIQTQDHIELLSPCQNKCICVGQLF